MRFPKPGYSAITAALLIVLNFSVAVGQQQSGTIAEPVPVDDVSDLNFEPVQETPLLSPEPVDPDPLPTGSNHLGSAVSKNVPADTVRLEQPSADDRYQELERVFEGKDFLKDNEDLPQQISIRVRQFRSESVAVERNNSVYHEMREVPYYEVQTVQTTSDELSPEQRLGVIIALQEEKIAQALKELMAEQDDKKREQQLRELEQLYIARFDVDTAYQDYKVRKIELRAAKLRADVTAREKAVDQWAAAMVTLAKMRAAGIETMHNVSPTPGNLAPTPIGAPGQTLHDSRTPSLPSPGMGFPSTAVPSSGSGAMGLPPANPAGGRPTPPGGLQAF